MNMLEALTMETQRSLKGFQQNIGQHTEDNKEEMKKSLKEMQDYRYR